MDIRSDNGSSESFTDEKQALEAYADEQYQKLQREKEKYLDDYCAQRGIE